MNIFVVDESPVVSAQQLCDKHVVKMILESAQMLSTAHRVLDGHPCIKRTPKGRKVQDWILDDDREDMIYRAHQPKHPCTIWTRVGSENYKWHCEHAYELCKEYTRRYDKVHKAEPMIRLFNQNLPNNIEQKELTPFAQAMPEIYKNEDAVLAYRSYYINKKARFAKWKNGNVPTWFEEALV